MDTEPLEYQEILKKLEAKYLEVARRKARTDQELEGLKQTIHGMKKLRALTSRNGPAVDYAGMDASDAGVQCLRKLGRKATVKEIEEILRQAHYDAYATDLYQAIYQRFRRDPEIGKAPDGKWFLKEWPALQGKSEE